MNPKKKIAVLGIGQSNFLDQLYGQVASKSADHSFYIHNYSQLDSAQNNPELPEFYAGEISGKTPLGFLKKIQVFLNFMFHPLFFPLFFIGLAEKRGFRNVIKKLSQYSLEKHWVEQVLLPRKFDAYHYHYCISRYLIQVHFLPKDSRILCSFWGSDLMRVSNPLENYITQRALKKSRLITAQHQEMGEIIYSKFGRDLMDKMNFVRFTLNTKIYEHLDDLIRTDPDSSAFREKYNIPKNTYIVALGHNAFQENNHLKMIAAFKQLPDHIRQRFTLLLHLSYGGNPSYIGQIEQLLKDEASKSSVLITDYMMPLEMAQLRQATDILIQMPISDALSAAMTEVLYAKKTVFAASWLPYGILRRNGLHYFELDTFEQITQALESFLGNFENIMLKNSGNSAKIESLLFPERTTADWIRVFEKL